MSSATGSVDSKGFRRSSTDVTQGGRHGDSQPQEAGQGQGHMIVVTPRDMDSGDHARRAPHAKVSIASCCCTVLSAQHTMTSLESFCVTLYILRMCRLGYTCLQCFT
jgi:hypothetical protein